MPGAAATVTGGVGDDPFAIGVAGGYTAVWADSPPPGVGTPAEQLLTADTPGLTVAGGGGSDTVAVVGPVAVPVTLAGTGPDAVAVPPGRR